ncbi:hypothetical protein [Streptomyces sp. FxanaA7]|uniref:hypothetical protein n=1 Tax=Streptomyces sp. FxanaA7 TaxID=1265492 RepID=UPI0005EEE0BB|nr:hypothetical protein [Streptomyces sp. FxanaA7]
MPPSRASIAFGVFLLVLCAVSAVGCAVRGEWWWAAAGGACAVFLGRELLGDLAERRYWRARRPW